MKAKMAWTFVLAIVLVTACGGGTSTDLPWNDDFSTPGSWQTETDAVAEVGVQDGVMRINVKAVNQLAWAFAGRDVEDFHLTVEATQVAGPDDNEYGVLARLQDADNFYRFSISGDGYYLISKSVDDIQEPLGSNWTPSDAINQGLATNVIEVICEGNVLTLIVNGQQLAQVEDDQFAHGDIGLHAGTFYQAGVEIHFDNLSVNEP